MAAAAAAAVPVALRPAAGVAVTHHAAVREVEGFRVLGAGHPLPDEGGVEAARAVAAIAQAAGDGDLLLVLISGGGSALLPAPAPGVALNEKIAVTDLLLKSGADIHELNIVRKHLSILKGGGLARMAAPAELHALVLSDVIDDDLSTIASGPTVPDPSTFADALAVLSRRGLLDRAPESVRRRLFDGAAGKVPETPKPSDPCFAGSAATLIGGNRTSIDAVRRRAEELGWSAALLGRPLAGEARRQAEPLLLAAVDARGRQAGRLALVAGGETTVTVRGGGRGGRNQELALAFALGAERRELPGDWVFLSGGTDGRDGPTDAAGGLVDRGTIERIERRGLSAQGCLDDNDSYEALAASGDLVRTGPTGTNVADLQIFLWV
jgi:hydroxypyruvate reductase